MRINTNVAALNAWRNLSVTGGQMAKSLEKLSSGLRINKASDDAAGLAVSERMRAQIAGLGQASRNAQDGISLIQTAEGALNETHSILQRVRELVLQANNSTNQDEDLAKIQDEIIQLRGELTGIAERTEFNGLTLLDGTLGAAMEVKETGLGDAFQAGTGALKIVDVAKAQSGDYTVTVDETAKSVTLAVAGHTQTLTVGDNPTGTLDFDKMGVKLELATTTTIAALKTATTGDKGKFTLGLTEGTSFQFQIGANDGQKIELQVASVKADALGTATLKIEDLDVTNFADAGFQDQLGAVDGALSSVSTMRSQLGAYQNRLEHTIANLEASKENLSAAESRIRDVDMALEMASFTRHMILQQAGTAMLAQANVQAQSVLRLLG